MHKYIWKFTMFDGSTEDLWSIERDMEKLMGKSGKMKIQLSIYNWLFMGNSPCLMGKLTISTGPCFSWNERNGWDGLMNAEDLDLDHPLVNVYNIMENYESLMRKLGISMAIFHIVILCFIEFPEGNRNGFGWDGWSSFLGWMEWMMMYYSCQACGFSWQPWGKWIGRVFPKKIVIMFMTLGVTPPKVIIWYDMS